MYRKWYPPARYICYPLYRRLRRGWRLPSAVAYFAVWLISGLAHGAPMLLLSTPLAAAVFTSVFVGLGLAGAAAVLIKNRRHRRALCTSR